MPPRNGSYVRGGATHVVLTFRFMQKIGRLGAQARVDNSTKAQRQEWARRAAIARWRKADPRPLVILAALHTGVARKPRRAASLRLAEKSYTTLVLSTLVDPYDWNFGRDRLSYRNGFPKPAVIHTKSGIGWSAVPDPNTPGSKFHPLHREALYFVYERSEILAEMLNWFNIVGDQLTTVHPNAADENEIIDWTLRKFSKLEIKNKILLLQYPHDLDTTEVAERRKLILVIANELSLKVVDTYDVLRNGKENELWYHEGSHHTPLGNELVCSYLFEQGFTKQTNAFRPDSPSTGEGR